MQATRWGSLSADEKADALRRELGEVEANEKRNVQARFDQFQKIDKRLAQLAEELKRMESRLSQIEWQLRK